MFLRLALRAHRLIHDPIHTGEDDVPVHGRVALLRDRYEWGPIPLNTITPHFLSPYAKYPRRLGA